MDANVISLLSFMRNVSQLRLPLYQRWYKWEISDCDRLWDDAMRVGSDPDTGRHYMGAITTMFPDPCHDASDGPTTLVDGQQRLATSSLLLEAIARHMPAQDAPPGFAPNQIRARYLMDPLETGEERYKLVLTHSDRQTLFGLLHEDALLPPDPSPNLVETFNHYCRKVRRLSTPELHALCAGITKFMIVHITLHSLLDDAYQIFESLNDRGRLLSPSDLIRLYLLMHEQDDMQQQIHASHLLPLEIEFGRDDYDRNHAAFVRAFLTLRTGQRPPQTEIHPAFKTYANSAAIRQARARNSHRTSTSLAATTAQYPAAPNRNRS